MRRKRRLENSCFPASGFILLSSCLLLTAGAGDTVAAQRQVASCTVHNQIAEIQIVHKPVVHIKLYIDKQLKHSTYKKYRQLLGSTLEGSFGQYIKRQLIYRNIFRQLQVANYSTYIQLAGIKTFYRKQLIYSTGNLHTVHRRAY